MIGRIRFWNRDYMVAWRIAYFLHAGLGFAVQFTLEADGVMTIHYRHDLAWG